MALRLPLIALAAVLAATPALAQDRLFVGPSELGAFGHFGQRLGTAPSPVHGQFVAGGRYVVALEWIALFTSRLRVYDTRTGLVTQELNGSVLAVDPTGPHVFVLDGNVVIDHDLDGRTSRPLITAEPWNVPPSPFSKPVLAAYASASGELFVNRRAPGGTGSELVVVRVRDGAIARTLAPPDPGQPLTRWLASPDGRRLWALDFGAINRFPTVSVFDGQSGALQASQPTAGSDLIDDRRFQRIYVLGQNELHAYDDNLSLLATLPLRGSCGQPNVAVSPHTGRIYILESEGGGGSSTAPRFEIAYFLSVIDGATGRRLDSRTVTADLGPATTSACLEMPVTVLTAPLAPRGLTVNVSGRDVALTWANDGNASDFVLEAGLVPGRTDVSFSIGATSPVTIANAPPGTYYLRVRGTNAFGVSRPSNEVVVTVP